MGRGPESTGHAGAGRGKLRGGPVSRILSKGSPPLDDHSSRRTVADTLGLPTRIAGVKRPVMRSLFGIAPGGACRAAPVASGAVGSYPTVSPFPRRTGVVSFLWRFPSDRSARVLPGTVASGSPDFPRGVATPRPSGPPRRVDL
ncbi:hypothetical protein roselon_02059 [Roseibacterium elongatum DSM 19469]|uniref:Uncharacterized protein n=1 Tax=Roseicyclus elongatus DSM 19469 TaxID=1294273 RepID=W8SPI6_9RHOB|nr:hypothetical protein roselon_02059 [Roseibacterium elongatum DSM 19469]